ncbi:MAG: cobalamin biosynthesis protein, partial [Chloroflexi bacterium]|nr:cobalamin biosynthesis protein [Chloroflexota bacterium]
MSRTAIVAISQGGSALARTLALAWDGAADLFLKRGYRQLEEAAQEFDLPLRPVIGRVLSEYPAVVLFLPVGAAVRLIAPHLRDKHQDPAVVCVDEAGTFAVSLVSGHVGGADRLAQEVAAILGATPVITSASHVSGTLAVDLLGREFGWTIEADDVTVTRASAAVVNGELIGVFQSAGERDWWPVDTPLPDNIVVYDSLESLVGGDCSVALIISDHSNPLAGEGDQIQPALGGRHLVLYRPRSLVAGMGCRRGVPLGELDQLLLETFRENNLSLASLACIATAELKQDEPGLIALADQYDVPLVCYSGDDLNQVFASQDGVPGES